MLRCSCAQLYEAYLATGGPEAKIVHPAFEQEPSGEPTLGHDGQTVPNSKEGQPKTWDELTVPEKEGARWLDSLQLSSTVSSCLLRHLKAKSSGPAAPGLAVHAFWQPAASHGSQRTGWRGI